MFALNPALDPERLATRYARDRRVRIVDFLTLEGARALSEEAARRNDWSQIVNAGSKVWDLSRETRARMDPAKARALEMAVYQGAREGFQHRYEAIRVPDDAADRDRSDDMFAAFAHWLSQGEARDFLRCVTGSDAISFADSQATAYGPGDFLTVHHDAAQGKQRIAAYVYGLSPEWRADWGGLLLFHRDDGDAEAWVPRFNALNLFAVPQPHSVSMVNAIAPCPRYSITGWLRAAS